MKNAQVTGFLLTITTLRAILASHFFQATLRLKSKEFFELSSYEDRLIETSLSIGVRFARSCDGIEWSLPVVSLTSASESLARLYVEHCFSSPN